MAERWKIFPHRGDFWHHTPARQWYLHTVSRLEISMIQYLNVSGVPQSANLPTLRRRGRAESLCG